MNQDEFLGQIKATWQSVELPHKALLRKARRNFIWYWAGVAYNAVFAAASIFAGIWLLMSHDNDLLYWLLGLTCILLLPAGAYFSVKTSWAYIQWQDKSAIGTLSQLIKQCEIEIRLSVLARNVALAYVVVPLIGIAAHHLELTQVPLPQIISVSLGVMTSTVMLLVWLHFRLKRKHQELNKLMQMKRETQDRHD